jgi:hypothetical protein
MLLAWEGPQPHALLGSRARLMLRLRLLLLFGLLPFALSCAEEDERPPRLASGGGYSAPGGGGEDYPEGPYGTDDPEVGDVVEDLKLLGHLGVPGEVTEPGATLDDLTLSEVREGGASHLLVHVSGIWCATCQVEASILSQYSKDIVDAGGATLELVVDGQVLGADPTKEELDVWVELNDLEVTTMGPGDDRLRSVFPTRDMVYIIDLETMTVVWRQDGPQNGRAASETGALEILSGYLAE